MTTLSERMKLIDASGIRKVFALAAQMKNPINLSIGQPDYDVDADVKAGAIDAINSGQNGYTQTWGIQELREACADYYESQFGARLPHVMITSGVSGGLYLALMATLNPGDEVIFGDPYFVMYKHLVKLLGGVPVMVDTYPDFQLTPERVAQAVTPRTKMVIVNSPSNPTGVTLSAPQMDGLAEVARAHDLWVISDEIYEGLTYDDARVSMAGRYDKAIILNGFSKVAAMTGWRVGYAAGPEGVLQAMNTLQQYTFVCAPSMAQWAAVKSFKIDHSPKVEAYRRKRDLLYDGLGSIGIRAAKAGGAFYTFAEAPGGNGDAFVEAAIKNELLIIPGSVFSEKKSHVRISFAAPDATIEKGLTVLERLKKEFS